MAADRCAGGGVCVLLENIAGFVGMERGMARDRMSKIVFQQMVRESPLSFDQLLAKLCIV